MAAWPVNEQDVYASYACYLIRLALNHSTVIRLLMLSSHMTVLALGKQGAYTCDSWDSYAIAFSCFLDIQVIPQIQTDADL